MKINNKEKFNNKTTIYINGLVGGNEKKIYYNFVKDKKIEED